MPVHSVVLLQLNAEALFSSTTLLCCFLYLVPFPTLRGDLSYPFSLRPFFRKLSCNRIPHGVRDDLRSWHWSSSNTHHKGGGKLKINGRGSFNQPLILKESIPFTSIAWGIFTPLMHIAMQSLSSLKNWFIRVAFQVHLKTSGPWLWISLRALLVSLKSFYRAGSTGRNSVRGSLKRGSRLRSSL